MKLAKTLKFVHRQVVVARTRSSVRAAIAMQLIFTPMIWRLMEQRNFLDLELEDPVPDATTIWLFREALAQAGLIDKLFERFGQHLEAEGYIARGGQIIDATIVSVPKQRNTKEENETIKAGKTPEEWEQQPAKNAQKDKNARWTKKNDASFFGYKNHLGVDKAHKLVRKWDATDAAVHDSQKLDDVLDLSNTGDGVWADSAYRSAQIEAGLKAKGLQSHIHRRAARNRPLSERQKSANTTRSRVRARVDSATSRTRWAAWTC